MMRDGTWHNVKVPIQTTLSGPVGEKVTLDGLSLAVWIYRYRYNDRIDAYQIDFPDIESGWVINDGQGYWIAADVLGSSYASSTEIVRTIYDKVLREIRYAKQDHDDEINRFIEGMT